MKKILFVIMIAAVASQASAFCLYNKTNYPMKVDISYPDWWFDHSYNLSPHEQGVCTMDGLAPRDWRLSYSAKINWQLDGYSFESTRYMEHAPTSLVLIAEQEGGAIVFHHYSGD